MVLLVRHMKRPKRTSLSHWTESSEAAVPVEVKGIKERRDKHQVG